jgi:hypothetical protein
MNQNAASAPKASGSTRRLDLLARRNSESALEGARIAWVQPVVATLPWFLHCNTVFTAVQSDADAAEGPSSVRSVAPFKLS